MCNFACNFESEWAHSKARIRDLLHFTLVLFLGGGYFFPLEESYNSCHQRWKSEGMKRVEQRG